MQRNNNRNRIFIVALIWISFFITLCHVTLFNSTLSDVIHLGQELLAKEGILATWTLGDAAPFKYRVLFTWIIKGTHRLFFDYTNNTGFYYTFVFWSFIFSTATGIALYYFLKAVQFKEKYAFVGCIMFYLSAPVIFAYIRPVHIREDFLGYLILILGLTYIIKNKSTGVLILSILGVFCRETLLIIPFIYLFFTKEKLLKRFIIALIPVALHLLIRLVIGYETYKILELGLMYNIRNFNQTLLFFYFTFGILWIPFFIDLFRQKSNKKNYLNNSLQLLHKSAPWVFILIFLSTFIGGRISEIRLLFLLFPWVISFSLFFIKENLIFLRRIIAGVYYKIYLSFLFLLLIFSFIFFFERYWILTGLTNLILILAVIPPLFSLSLSKR